MATEKLPARRVVYVGVPRGVDNDLDKVFRVTKSVLGKLGCDGCHSGFDLRFVPDTVFVANAKGEIVGG